jgi:hypothetical protein
MIDPVTFSARENGVEFLTIAADGGITTRHRRADGVLHWHYQKQVLVTGFMHTMKPFEAWSANVLPLPPSARTLGDPESIAVLVRADYGREIPFAFPFAALTSEAAERIVHGVPGILLLVHDGQLSCATSRYDDFRAGQSAH